MGVRNYTALAVQKQPTTMLKTGQGVIGSEEVYDNPANIVTWVQNPRRGGANGTSALGWMIFGGTYTFSGLKRPGATISQLMPPVSKPTASDAASSEYVIEEEEEAVRGSKANLKDKLSLAQPEPPIVDLTAVAQPQGLTPHQRLLWDQIVKK